MSLRLKTARVVGAAARRASDTSCRLWARQVELELSDTSPRRAANKRVAAGSWLEIRGRPTLHQCDASDESGLRVLLGVLDAINRWADAWVPGCTVPAPRVDERDALPA